MWINVAQLDELNEVRPLRIQVKDEFMVLFRSGDHVYCMRDVCSHMEYPLSDGVYHSKQRTITCAYHGAKFDVESGRALSMPAVSSVPTYPVRIIDNEVQIDYEE
ncbi:MAG: Rieske 2Fe-2S domain-containing protein [bacterium]|nr:Rieske 2Fe-2S domain-containing protein [bacterium]